MIRALLNLYILVLIIDVILSYLPQFKHTAWASQIRRATGFTCAPIRKLLPKDVPFDFSPVIVIFIIKVVEVLW